MYAQRLTKVQKKTTHCLPKALKPNFPTKFSGQMLRPIFLAKHCGSIFWRSFLAPVSGKFFRRHFNLPAQRQRGQCQPRTSPTAHGRVAHPVHIASGAHASRQANNHGPVQKPSRNRPQGCSVPFVCKCLPPPPPHGFPCPIDFREKFNIFARKFYPL